jgi:hypothetical protein
VTQDISWKTLSQEKPIQLFSRRNISNLKNNILRSPKYQTLETLAQDSCVDTKKNIHAIDKLSLEREREYPENIASQRERQNPRENVFLVATCLPS